MIIQEHFDVNGQDFIRTYSDAGRYVVRGDVEYEEACDPADLGRTYTEGDVMPMDENDATEILDILIGGGGE